MKKFIFVILFALASVNLAEAKTVYCTNCSTRTTQAIEKATSIDQLKTLAKQYAEEMEQTEAQLRMVQQNIEQYANMLQNTKQLNPNLRAKLKDSFIQMAMQQTALKTQRGDIQALSEIFAQAYPDYAELSGMVTSGSGQDEYREQWDNWAKEINRASEATFQLSGAQLEELQADSATFDQYIDDLLNTPEGQMQALQSGNQLAALQLRENRQLRGLMATSIQSGITQDMKNQKEREASEALWRAINNTDKFKNLSVDDARPLP